MEKELVGFLAERDAMLLACDVDRAIAFWRKWSPEYEPSSRFVAEIAIHKARTAVKTLPLDARRESKRWLLERGFESADDGDVSM